VPIAINDVETLKEYLNGVMSRAEHHGPSVSGIGLALAGAIIWRKDPEPIEVHEGRSMAHGTVLWVRIGGQRYAFRYNHDTGAIELRRGTIRGDVLHAFTDATPIGEVERVFRAL
jgi:integron cassette protein